MDLTTVSLSVSAEVSLFIPAFCLSLCLFPSLLVVVFFFLFPSHRLFLAYIVFLLFKPRIFAQEDEHGLNLHLTHSYQKPSIDCIYQALYKYVMC